MEERIQELEKINIDLQEEVEDLKREIDELKRDLVDAEEDNEELRDQIGELKEEAEGGYTALTDQMKFEYFKDNFCKITQDQLEKIVNG